MKNGVWDSTRNIGCFFWIDWGLGALGFGLKSFSPEPPPRGGVREVKTKESFAEFHRSRRSASNRDREAILAQRRAS